MDLGSHRERLNNAEAGPGLANQLSGWFVAVVQSSTLWMAKTPDDERCPRRACSIQLRHGLPDLEHDGATSPARAPLNSPFGRSSDEARERFGRRVNARKLNRDQLETVRIALTNTPSATGITSVIVFRGTGELGTVRFGSVRLDLPHSTPQTGRFGDLLEAGSTAPWESRHQKW